MKDKFIQLGNEIVRMDSVHHIMRTEHSLQQIDFASHEAYAATIVALKDGRAYNANTTLWFDWQETHTPDATEVPFKYDEARLLKEFDEYVASTYGKHYVGEDNIQSLDLIFATGHGDGFCTGNVIKYSARQGKKAGSQRDDIMKVMHYALLLLYLYDKKEAKKK